jgi:hypothetical protein
MLRLAAILIAALIATSASAQELERIVARGEAALNWCDYTLTEYELWIMHFSVNLPEFDKRKALAEYLMLKAALKAEGNDKNGYTCRMLRESVIPESSKPGMDPSMRMQCIPGMLRADCYITQPQNAGAVTRALVRLKASEVCEGWSNTDEQARVADYVIKNSGFGQKQGIWRAIEAANHKIGVAGFCRVAGKILRE